VRRGADRQINPRSGSFVRVPLVSDWHQSFDRIIGIEELLPIASKRFFTFQKTIDLRRENAILHDRSRVYDR
jgi:hypothetical protein